MTKKEYNELYTEAENLIKVAFVDKLDKGGKPYIGHLHRVAFEIEDKELSKASYNDDLSSLKTFYQKAVIVALLHDILEDTDCTVDVLQELGFDEEIVNAVVAITRKKEEQFYFDFIERVNKNDIAKLVKIYDLRDNMDITRLTSFGDYEQKRLKKYWYCWKYLKGEITAIECNNAIHPNRLWR